LGVLEILLAAALQAAMGYVGYRLLKRDLKKEFSKLLEEYTIPFVMKRKKTDGKEKSKENDGSN